MSGGHSVRKWGLAVLDRGCTQVSPGSSPQHHKGGKGGGEVIGKGGGGGDQ